VVRVCEWGGDVPPDLVLAGAARSLAELVHGPFGDLATAEAGCLVAEGAGT